jgi:maltose O-acetyltransferase
MLAGQLYRAGDPELVADRAHAERLLRSLNMLPKQNERRRLLDELLGSVGERVEVRPPFFCDYGFNIHIGADSFLNFNCVILDTVTVTIGDRVQIGSAVQILAADHPLDPDIRTSAVESGRPVVIEDDVWIGAGAILVPGVTIGADSVIGAGSVVTREIPAGVVAVGNPCRVLRRVSAGPA